MESLNVCAGDWHIVPCVCVCVCVCVRVIHERQPCFSKQLIAAWDVSSFSRHSKVKRSDVSIRY